MILIINQKYEITDIAHEKHPSLHRIRALRDIGSEVKAGDLGGFVESENNLSFEPGDDAWIFNDAIAAGTAYLDADSCLRDRAVICDRAHISQETVLRDDARAEGDAYVRGALLMKNARAAGSSLILISQRNGKAPVLSDHCSVYGKIMGDVRVTGKAVVLGGEAVCSETRDTLFLNERGRTAIRDTFQDRGWNSAQTTRPGSEIRSEQNGKGGGQPHRQAARKGWDAR